MSQVCPNIMPVRSEVRRRTGSQRRTSGRWELLFWNVRTLDRQGVLRRADELMSAIENCDVLVFRGDWVRIRCIEDNFHTGLFRRLVRVLKRIVSSYEDNNVLSSRTDSLHVKLSISLPSILQLWYVC